MTQVDSLYKRAGDFFAALYRNAPPELFLELRCIHPATHDSKVLWATIGAERSLEATLRQAEQLNHAGYGIYFAPCLRREKRGKAEAAALLPVLWVDIDCDGDLTQLERGRAKMMGFDPPPSILVSSGGGWHGYWLLDTPLDLHDTDAKQYAANLLRGLSAAVGGDVDYVKSVASLMRVPESINTKPERSGVMATIEQFEAEHRVSLDAFAWLMQADTHPIGSSSTTHLHLLPERTQAYLASGATEGNRNTELFQAACQLRDAGYSQSDAEAQLVPRSVVDGCSEREALATIKSAYSRPPRIRFPVPVGRLIRSLVNTAARSQPSAHPPTRLRLRSAHVPRSTRCSGRQSASGSNCCAAMD